MNVRLWFASLRAGALALSASALVAGASSAGAALLAYEPFNYPTGSGMWTDAGQLQTTASLGGDFGWKEVWRSGGNANDTNIQTLPGSMGYSVGGRTLVTAGNRWWVSGDASAAGDNFNPAGPNNVSPSPYRRMSFANQRGFSTTADSTTWTSFLADLGTVVSTGNHTGAGADGGTINYGRGVGAFQLFGNVGDNIANDDPAMGSNTQGNENLSFGRGTQNSEVGTGSVELGYPNDTWGALNRGAAPQTKASNVPLTTQVFVLMRIDHKAGLSTASAADDAMDDTAYIWINPSSLSVEPALGTQDLTINPNSFTGAPVSATNNDRDYNFNRIRIFGGNLNTAPGIGYSSVIVDEFRVGETFADVTPNVPEPTGAALAACGLLAAMGARRRQ